MVNRDGRFWRALSLGVLALGLGATGGAVVVLYTAYSAVVEVIDEQAKRRYLAGLAVLAGVLVIFAAFCMALLVIRFLTQRMGKLQGRHGPTEYVDAWKLAGERFQLADEEDDESPDATEP